MENKEFWSASKIRTTFLDFFKSKDHLIVPSDPIVRHGDPTLMFTNAGMNQFKDVFLGYKEPPAPRVANTQRCLRVSGKHNDLEQVGYDGYHHTMFEMLGNWSFGDYFKREAIHWAWELLTKVYKIPEDRLYATYFGGEGGIEPDLETKEIWKEILPEDRILPFGMKDNFWEMGDTGPCGPSTEIHIDLRPEEERQKVKAQDLINRDHPFVIELWNLVFIQFNRKEDGSLERLKTHYVDTGMGLERLAMTLQGVDETYKTDLFTPLIQFVEEYAGVYYGENEKTTVAIRVVVDHIRAVAFAIADGALPSSTGPGYVVRRLLRRAVRYYYQYLGIKEPFLYKLLPILVKQFENVFPEIKKQEHFVAMVIKEEEAQFLKTLAVGLKRFQEVAEAPRQSGVIPGKHVFELYDTYGFPPDLTELLAREKGLKIDLEGFHKHMAEQRERARKAQQQKISDWHIIKKGEPEFVGYDTLETETRILRWREVEDKKGKKYHIVLEKTPFYPEGGGQVGDKGILKTSKGNVKVMDTQKEMNLIYVITEDLPSFDEPIIAIVDTEKRKRAEQHHSATHLLHASLRKLLGPHVQQKGSYLDDQYLRFDFSHPKPLTKEELKAIEKLVNQKIQENIPLKEYRNIPISEALAMGALAFFGEKYGDRVRVVVFDPDFSIELCGGTHVKATGEIGIFKITSESGVSAGI
ncbi:MAG: alanine--tRNA ligase, partial [Chlorobi bacterium]|nr:alanine--tRNA ligase [Chlorobiota bacterium]